MTSWKVKLGGALSSLGVTLSGIGLIPGSTNMTAAENLKWVVIAGVILQAAGGFFLSLGRDNDTTSEDVAAVKLSKLLAKADVKTAISTADTEEIKKLQARIESVEPVNPPL